MDPSPSTEGQPLPARDRILQAAHLLFYRDGIRATGVDRLIAESGVTKVTFYRHFPSKKDLVLAFLEQRHERWMAWFRAAVQRHGARHAAMPAMALVPALAEWLARPDYRGCAFINSVGELGTEMPEVVEVARRHKDDLRQLIQQLLPPGKGRTSHAQALALAVDGAIFHAQLADSPEKAVKALKGLETVVMALAGSGAGD